MFRSPNDPSTRDDDEEKMEKNDRAKSARADSPADGSEEEVCSGRAESETSEEDDSEEVLDLREKFLIFTMGSRTYTPHQIGIDLCVFA